jgi:hypothetical protein
MNEPSTTAEANASARGRAATPPDTRTVFVRTAPSYESQTSTQRLSDLRRQGQAQALATMRRAIADASAPLTNRLSALETTVAELGRANVDTNLDALRDLAGTVVTDGLSPCALTAFSGHGRSGAFRTWGVPPGERWRAISMSAWSESELFRAVSSVDLISLPGYSARLFLFTHKIPRGPLRAFEGQFFHFSTDVGTAAWWDLAGVQDNANTSALLVAYNARAFSLNIADHLRPMWVTELDKRLPADVTRTGPPSFSWVGFPTSYPELDARKTYLHILQGLHIAIPDWPDYSAWIDFHLEFGLRPDGTIFIHLARGGAAVENGLLAPLIQAALDGQIAGAMCQMQAVLDDQADALGKAPVEDVYLLPGPPLIGAGGSSTFDDPALILILKQLF